MPLKMQIVITALLLAASILIFGLTDIDLIIQDHLYDFTHQTWLLDKHTEPYHTLLYSGIKKLLVGLGAILLFVYILFRKHPRLHPYKKGMMIILLSSVLVPTITVGLKKATNIPCPKHEIRYGGEYPRTSIWESYPPTLQNKKRIACWPAGHASGGFALMSLFFLFRHRRYKVLALLVALLIGWSMGIYKILVGDHFFSHTLITMLIAWLLILIIAMIVEKFFLKQIVDTKETKQ